MQFYTFSNEDKIATAYNRCFFDAENGRTWLALLRLEDMRNQFPDDPDINHAEAIIRVRFLGQGLVGQDLCWKAFTQKPNLQDTSQALSLALNSSPDANTFQTRAAVALRTYPNDQSVKQIIQLERESREEGKPHWIFLDKFLTPLIQEQGKAIDASLVKDPGIFASRIELILHSGSNEIPPDEKAHYLRFRGELLRELDRTAENKLKFLGENFIPKDRLSLQQALSEFEKNIDDPYFRDAETLNLCAAWSFLLHCFQDSINFADEAEELGGPEYINPIQNKALAYSALGDGISSKNCFQKALEIARRHGDDARAQNILLAMEEQKKLPPPQFHELRPKFESVLGGDGDVSYHEITAAKGTLESMGGHFAKRLKLIGLDWSPKYFVVVAELLAFYSPESAHFIIAKALESFPEERGKQVVGHLTIATHFLAANANGVLRRDCVRLRTLQLISLLDADIILEVYRKQVRDISLEANRPLSEVADLIKDEMARFHPLMPNFLDNLPPMSTDDRKNAQFVINEFFMLGQKQTIRDFKESSYGQNHEKIQRTNKKLSFIEENKSFTINERKKCQNNNGKFKLGCFIAILFPFIVYCSIKFSNGNYTIIYIISSVTISLLFYSGMENFDIQVSGKPRRELDFFLDSKVGCDEKLSAEHDEFAQFMLKGSVFTAFFLLTLWFLIILFMLPMIEKSIIGLVGVLTLSLLGGYIIAIAIYNIYKRFQN